MAYQKLQGRRAINVYVTTDNVPIPSPSSKLKEGQNDAVVVGFLQDSTTDFFALKVKAGDVVYNTTTGASAKVLQVLTNDLLLNANIFLVVAENYVIYSMELSEDGPVLFVGTGGDLNIVTSGGDTVLLTNLANASYVPIMVRSVQSTGTTCSDIIALW
jgi:hypothetical protein